MYSSMWGYFGGYFSRCYWDIPVFSNSGDWHPKTWRSYLTPKLCGNTARVRMAKPP